MKQEVIWGDCLIEMDNIKDKSVDLIVCDLPYGVTQHKNDVVLDLEYLWKQYERIIKDKGIIVLTAQQPFTTDLINSNRKLFRYSLVWDKKLTSGFLNAKRMPLRQHEDILVFYKKLGTYNPQFTKGSPLHSKGINYKNKEIKNQNYGEFNHTDDTRRGSTEKYPTSIISIQKPHPSKALHRTEKPVELADWIIKTFSNEKDVVLDNTCGTGWTAVSCKKNNRNFIGMDIDENFCNIARKRISSSTTQKVNEK